MKYLKLYESFSEDWKSKAIEIRVKYTEDKQEWINSIKKSLIESMRDVCDDWEYQLNTIVSPNTDVNEDERLEDTLFQFKFNVSVVPSEFEKFVDIFIDSVLETLDRLEMNFFGSDLVITRFGKAISRLGGILSFKDTPENWLMRWKKILIEELNKTTILNTYPDVRGEVTITFHL